MKSTSKTRLFEALRTWDAKQVAEALEACGLLPWTQGDAVSWWERHLPATSALRLGIGAARSHAPAVERL